MTRSLLTRGMIVGVLAALLVTLFARVVAEPQVDLAIGYEARHEAAMARMAGHAVEEEDGPVSRDTQKGAGLLIAIVLYGSAMGGIFSLVFAATYGRVGAIGPRTLALLLALGAFVAIALVPALKYPPNPPAVGQHETVAFRTLAYFAMIALSILSLVMSIRFARGLVPRIGGLNAMLVMAGLYALAMIIVQAVLPAINEVPADFPAVLLWQFRVSALAMQVILWLAIGIGFGAWAERLLRAQGGRR
jgi:predicted cobalt transporter CbtA